MRRRAVAIGLLLAVAVPGAAVAVRPLDESDAFTGVVRVEWVDDAGRHVARMRVVVEDGVMVVDGPRPLAAMGGARMVWSTAEQGWATVWPAGLGTSRRPSPESKYDLVERRGPDVAGHATTAVVIARDDVVWERRYVDATTGLVLRREQFDREGRLRRVVSFEALLPTPASVDAPGRSTDRSPRATTHDAPRSLGSGYRLLGAYRQGETVHHLYSDGVYDLSVFEQEGRLRRADLPAGSEPVRVGGRDGWRLRWAGGEVLVFQAGRAVYTVVGEAPWDDVVSAARSMPASGSTGVVDKLKRACRSLLDAFVP